MRKWKTIAKIIKNMCNNNLQQFPSISHAFRSCETILGVILRDEDNNNVTIGDTADAIVFHRTFKELLQARWIYSFLASPTHIFRTYVICVFMSKTITYSG